MEKGDSLLMVLFRILIYKNNNLTILTKASTKKSELCV